MLMLLDLRGSLKIWKCALFVRLRDSVPITGNQRQAFAYERPAGLEK